MLNITLIRSQIYRETQQLHCSDVGVREKHQLNYIVHAVCVGESVTNSSFSGEKIEDVEGSHPIGRILGKEMHKLGNKPCFFDGLSSSLIKAKVVVDHKRKVQQNLIIASKESFQFFDNTNSKLHNLFFTI